MDHVLFLTTFSVIRIDYFIIKYQIKRYHLTKSIKHSVESIKHSMLK